MLCGKIPEIAGNSHVILLTGQSAAKPPSLEKGEGSETIMGTPKVGEEINLFFIFDGRWYSPFSLVIKS